MDLVIEKSEFIRNKAIQILNDMGYKLSNKRKITNTKYIRNINVIIDALTYMGMATRDDEDLYNSCFTFQKLDYSFKNKHLK